MTPDQVRSIAISLSTADQPRLLLTLQDDFLRRLGDGSGAPEHKDMLQGPAPAQLLATLRERLTPELLARSRALRLDEGDERTRLTLRFEGGGEVRELSFDSVQSAPPAEITAFVATAVALTDRWYDQQLALARLGD